MKFIAKSRLIFLVYLFITMQISLNAGDAFAEYDKEDNNGFLNYSFERPSAINDRYPNWWSFNQNQKDIYDGIGSPDGIRRVEDKNSAYHTNCFVEFKKNGALCSPPFIERKDLGLYKQYSISIYGRKTNNGGKAFLNIIVHGYTNDKQWLMSKKSEQFELTGDWKKYEYNASFDDGGINVEKFCVMFDVSVEGNTAGLLDNASFSADSKSPSVELAQKEVKMPPVTFKADYDKSFNADLGDGGIEAEIIGKPESVDGFTGKGVKITGANGLKYKAKGNLELENGSGSISMWVKPINWTGTAKDKFTFLSADYINNPVKDGSKAGFFKIFKSNNHDIIFFAGADFEDANKKFQAKTSIESWWEANKWHHLAVSWNGFEMVIYLDGQERERKKVPFFNSGGEDPRFLFSIGKSFYVGYPQEKNCLTETVIDNLTIFSAPLKPEQARFLYDKEKMLAESAENQKASIPVPVTKNHPVIDGAINEAEWSDASSCNAFVELLGKGKKLFPYENKFFVKLSSERLYIALSSEYYDGRKVFSEAKHPKDVFQDNCFEVMLKAKSGPIMKYDINSNGLMACAQINPTFKLMETKAKGAVKLYDNKWTAELSIPINEVCSGTLAIGENFQIQIVRSYKKGTLEEREKNANPYDICEEYSGFPFNHNFFHSPNYALCYVVEENKNLKFDFGLKAYFSGKTCSLHGTLGSAWTKDEATVEVILAGARQQQEKILVPLNSKKEFSYVNSNSGAGDVYVRAGNLFRIEIPLAEQKNTVRSSVVIFSKSNTIELHIDISELKAFNKSDLVADIIIFDDKNNEVLKKTLQSFKSLKDSLEVSIKDLKAGIHTARTVVRDRSGKEIANCESVFEVFRSLPGMNNQIGISDKVPPPWEPVKLENGNVVSVWGRKYQFGNSILPENIIIKGIPVLSGGIKYHVELNNGSKFDIESGNVSKVSANDAECILKGAAEQQGVKIEHKITVEYDGMVRVDATVNSAGAEIRKLQLVIPYKKDMAKLFMPIASRGKLLKLWESPGEIIPGWKWSSENMYPLMWIADMKGGLCWFAGSDRTWQVDKTKSRQEASNAGMIVTFVDTSSDKVKNISFTYGLQAFPTKPDRKDFREFTRPNKFFSSYMPFCLTAEYNFDNVKALDDLSKKLDPSYKYKHLPLLLLPFLNFPRSVKDFDYKTKGLAKDKYDFAAKELDIELDIFNKVLKEKNSYAYIFPYITPTYSSDLVPEWKFYWSEWIHLPKHYFEHEQAPCASVANKEYTDFWLYSFKKYVTENRINGVFHDMSLCYAAAGNNGMGYEKDGVLYEEWPIWQLRELFKRIYTFHREIYPDALSGMNVGGQFAPPIHSFTDFLISAERYGTTADNSIYDATGDGNMKPYSYELGLPYGPRAMDLGWLKYEYAMKIKEPTVHMFGLVLLHDVVQWRVCENPFVRNAVDGLRKRFGIGYDRDITFYPYWESQDKYQADKDKVFISFYKNGDSLMAVIVNKRMKVSFDGEISIDVDKFGIRDIKKVTVFDPLENKYTGIPVDSKKPLKVKVDVGPTLFKAIIINIPER